jgi:hypothetical protein
VNYVTSSVFGLTCEAFLHGTVIPSTFKTTSIAHLCLGCYTILFAISIYLMVKRSRNRVSVNKHIFIISVFLYLSCTAHFALEFIHFYTLMVCTTLPHQVPRSMNVHAVTAKRWPGVLRSEKAVLTAADVLIIVTDFIGELILIYRCWLLWSRNYWVIILPSLTAIVSLSKSW